MHLLKRIRWFQATLAVAIIGTLGAAVFLGMGLLHKAETDALITHTASVLADLRAAQTAAREAEDEGRRVAQEGHGLDRLAPLRTKAISHIDHLMSIIRDNLQQRANLEELKDALLYQFELRDRQIASVQRNGEQITFPTALTIESRDADTRKNIAFERSLNDELILLHSRVSAHSVQRNQVAIGLITMAITSIVATIYLLVTLINELRQSQRMVAVLREMAGAAEGGSPSFATAEQLTALAKAFEEGELQLAAVRSRNPHITFQMLL